MRGRTSAEAVNNYVDAANRLVSCVTDSIVSVDGGYHPSTNPLILTLNNSRLVALRGLSNFRLQLQQTYRIMEPDTRGGLWAVRVTGYAYAILDSEQREVLVYHWHPRGNSPVVMPHLHLEHGALVGRPEVRDAHLPTGAVSIGSFLRLLIDDLSVEPARPDWESILQDDWNSRSELSV